MNTEIKVTFEPSGRSVFVLPNTSIIEAASRAGFSLTNPCGGAGTCGKCIVKPITPNSMSAIESSELNVLGEERAKNGFRLACQTKITTNAVIEIPSNSLQESGENILSQHIDSHIRINHSIKQVSLKLETPDRKDLSDVELIQSSLDLPLSMTALRVMPSILRENNFDIKATVMKQKIVDLLPANSKSPMLGVTFDIGTTTIVGTLIDLNTGEDLALSTAMNPQTSFGDDVISRIKMCREQHNGLEILHTAIIKTVCDIINAIVKKANAHHKNIYATVFAGNTTMQQILCNISPEALGEIPFCPAFRRHIQMSAREFGINIHPEGLVIVMPQIGGFVGGDTTAGIIATKLNELSKPSLLVDIGTNGEIVLAKDGKLLATSVAAGPAFEGARIQNGMRACAGAIEKIVIKSEDIEYNVISNTKPAGICGTALIDITAELLRKGIIDITGRIVDPDEIKGEISNKLIKRIINRGDYNDFLLVSAEETSHGEELFLYQRDIRELQLANAAIKAGINILLKIANIKANDLENIFLAGAFGNFIRRNNAVRIGMLPNIPNNKIKFIGNAVSFGAKAMLLSELEDSASNIALNTCHIDLSLRNDFQDEFGSAMIFPDNI